MRCVGDIYIGLRVWVERDDCLHNMITESWKSDQKIKHE